MTVEQCVYGPTCRAVPENTASNLKQITEVTRITDERRILQAINECKDQKGNYQVNDVINYLLGDDVEPGSPSSAVGVTSVDKAVTTIDLTSDAYVAAKRNSKDETIDLTAAGDTELDRAVAESLRDAPGIGILGGQVTREDEEISKVLEQSLAEDSKLGTKRKRGDLWFVDPLNPHDRMRRGSWPVGLKNVGNTCWFSAVIQSLFHLPVFRKLVLRFIPPAITTNDDDDSVSQSRNIQFMVELRRLFALMIGSKRKYIDPSKAIDILKEAFSGGGSISTNSSDSQQDVSEFQHKLLDWLEDAFRTVESVPTPPDSQQRNSDATARASNPVVKLFYGQYLSAGINKGTSFEKKDLFGQLPLQVNGFKDIHESLEAATAQGEIETLTEGDQSRACQEQWFIHLPPVLTFELSRFQFNKNLARPEKIHKQFDFPQQIYMDRYLERNRALTRQKRDEAKKLREALRDLQCRLDRFVNYGSGPKRFPIQDVLQYALEFAQSHGDGDATAPVGADRMLTTALGSPLAAAVREPATRQCGVVRADMADVDMESPRSQISIAMDSPAGSPIKPDPGVAAIDAAELPLLAQMPFKISVSAGDPSPRCISSNELHVLQTCLTRWRTEVEQDVKDLQTQITQIEERLEAMYSDAELMKCGYRLHAVLVHEGQAASGHYWAYVYSTTRNEWLKFNDVAVDVVSWDDIVKDGVGGYHNTSAYCIMYVNTDHPDLQQVTSWGDEAVPCDMTSRDTDSDSDLLLPDLQKYVEDDNDRFNAEILAWDSERRKTSRGAGGDGATAFVPGPDVRPALPPKAASLTRKTLMSQHLELFMSESKQLARMVVEWCKDNSVSAAAKQGYQHIVSAAESGAAHMLHTTLVRNDVRLRDVLVYFYLNKADDKVINRTYLEKLQLGVDVDSGGECAKMLLTAVTSELNNLAQQPTVESLCEQWHETYRYFRETVFTFINGVQAFHAERYREALPWFVEACRLTNHPVAAADSNRLPYKSIDSRVLYYYRRQCLLHVSEESVERFKSDDQIDELFAELQKIFLQCFYMLVCSSLPKDNEVVVSIRDAWCDILSVELTEPKREKLQDLLTVLLDATADSVWTAAATHQPARLLQYRELGDQLVANLDRAIDMAASHGYIEAAIDNQ